MPSLRQTSATVTPLSACCNANTICDSVNLDFFMAIVRLPSCHNCPLFSILFWPCFSGGGQRPRKLIGKAVEPLVHRTGELENGDNIRRFPSRILANGDIGTLTSCF